MRVLATHKINEGEPIPKGTELNLEFVRKAKRRWISNEDIERIEFYLDGSVMVRVKANPIVGRFYARELKFTGEEAKDIRRQVQKQSDQFTDVLGKQQWIGKQTRLTGRKLLATLRKRPPSQR